MQYATLYGKRKKKITVLLSTFGVDS